MKTFLFSVSLALTLIFLPATTVAGPTTSTTTGTDYQGEPLAEMPMIASKAALKTYALEQVRHGYSYIWSDGILKSFDEVRNITVTGTSADDVVKQLSSSTQSFRVRTYDKTKPVYVWSYLTNDAGDEFFQSNFGQVSLTETSAGLVISGTKIEFQMTWSIPIYFPNAVAARIEHVGADGNRWSEEVGVYNSKVYYPVSYAGTGGTLIVTTYYPNGGHAISPGESVDTAYGLSTGDKLPTTTITGQATFAIQNHLTGSDAGYASATSLVVSGRMTPPVDPVQNPWTIISPPTATFNVNAPAGTKRVCTMSVTIASTKLGSVEAWAHDASRVTPNGVEEIEGTVTKTVSGSDTIITVTWYLDNEVSTPGGANWNTYLIFRESYEIQGPAQPSNYGGEKG